MGQPIRVAHIVKSRLRETERVVERWTVRKGNLIHTLDQAIRFWKRDGTWERMDVAYFLATDAQADAYWNLKDPGTYTCTLNGAMTHVARLGIKSDGTTGYLSTTYNPTVASLGLSQNDMHSHASANTTDSGAGADLGCDNRRCSVRIRPGGSNAFCMMATTVSLGVVSGAIPTVPASCTGNRVGANQDVYANGVFSATAANASVGLPDAMTISRYNSTVFSNRQINFVCCGRGLTAAQVLTLHWGNKLLMRPAGIILP